MKNFNTILTENLPKYQPYHQPKLIKYEYLTGKEQNNLNLLILLQEKRLKNK